jgi:hypothetical protein
VYARFTRWKYKTCLGIPICYPVITMGKAMKYYILLAQAVIFSSLSFGQLKAIDYSLKESRISPMRFQKVTIRKQIAHAEVFKFNLIHRPERQLHRSRFNSTQLVYINRNAAHWGKANEGKILNYPRLLFLNAFKTNNKVGIKRNARISRRRVFWKDDNPLVATLDTRKAKLIENLDGISLQSINRFSFRQTHALEPGLPVQNLGRSARNTQ